MSVFTIEVEKLFFLPRMLPVCHRVDPDVPVLACREHVLVRGVHLHVVQRRLADLQAETKET